ncbi:MAG: hypothetical protein K2Z80_28030 [Xanthobacteraceae bacterium]|nr:hypothetical protein [Xanthobacteraceae bacterium]
MKAGTIRAGLLAALVWVLAALAPGDAAHAVTCPSAGPGEKLNIVTAGGATTCTNIGTSFATTGIEILNALTEWAYPDAFSGTYRMGLSFRRIGSSGNEQPAVNCIGACLRFNPSNGGMEPFDADVAEGSTVTLTGLVFDYGFGNGTTTLAPCITNYITTPGCRVTFTFADGTSGTIDVAAHSNTIPSFAIGSTSLLPEITSLSTSFVPYTGGEVVIRGRNLATVTSVTTWYLSPPFALRDQPFTIVSSEELRVTPSAPTRPLAGDGFAIQIRVNNPAGYAAAPFRFIAPPIRITTTSLPAAAIGAPYSAQIMTADGFYNWRGIENNARADFGAAGLPSGVSIQGSGLIAGTPTQAGVFEVTVSVTDYSDVVTSTANRTFSLVVNSPVSVTTSSLPAGNVGQSYTAPLAAAGGTTPYTFTATGLPAGLAVSGASITGTPKQTGNFTVGITARDSSSPSQITSLAASLSLSIVPAGMTAQTITFTQPAAVVFKAGGTVALKATSTSGLAVTFASTTPAVCTVSGTTATILATGTCTIKASQAGNATIAAAPDVTLSFAVSGAPTLSASATVTPTTFSRSGERLTFQITLTNSGGVTATGIKLVEARLPDLACAATTLAAGGKLSCQGTTLTTSADLSTGKISITPQLTYTYAGALP